MRKRLRGFAARAFSHFRGWRGSVCRSPFGGWGYSLPRGPRGFQHALCGGIPRAPLFDLYILLSAVGGICATASNTPARLGKKPHPPPQKGFTSTTPQASPPHELRKERAASPRGPFAIRGAWGDFVPPHKKKTPHAQNARKLSRLRICAMVVRSERSCGSVSGYAVRAARRVSWQGSWGSCVCVWGYWETFLPENVLGRTSPF